MADSIQLNYRRTETYGTSQTIPKKRKACDSQRVAGFLLGFNNELIKSCNAAGCSSPTTWNIVWLIAPLHKSPMSCIIFQRHGITFPDFLRLVMDGRIVDGRAGGFLFGRSHKDGGIPVISRCNDDTFAISDEFGGGEYLVNWDAYNAAKMRFDEINGHREQDVCELLSPRITPNSRLINTKAQPSDKIIWIDRRGCFVINKTATARYFAEIEKLNEEGNGFRNFDIMKVLDGMGDRKNLMLPIKLTPERSILDRALAAHSDRHRCPSRACPSASAQKFWSGSSDNSDLPKYKCRSVQERHW